MMSDLLMQIFIKKYFKPFSIQLRLSWSFNGLSFRFDFHLNCIWIVFPLLMATSSPVTDENDDKANHFRMRNNLEEKFH